ncbi:MAG: hypothetical protein HeimC2_21810 [Candidatus Heimdallarchaeota archaeon LC_2]|nr:MAG: hypothetical protein HeimC2_21810 [Candidatus Heimdallarchaeota archaeon LC_2]
MDKEHEINLSVIKKEISAWIDKLVEDPDEFFSADFLDDSNIIEDEESMIEIYNHNISNLQIQAVLTYYYTDYLRNNITHFDKYHGSLNLSIKVYFEIYSTEHIIFEMSNQVGTFSHSEDAEDYGDSPDLDFNSSFDEMVLGIEQAISELPDTMQFRINKKIHNKLDKLRTNVKNLLFKKEKTKLQELQIDKQIEILEDQITELQKSLINTIGQSNDKDNGDPTTVTSKANRKQLQNPNEQVIENNFLDIVKEIIGNIDTFISEEFDLKLDFYTFTTDLETELGHSSLTLEFKIVHLIQDERTGQEISEYHFIAKEIEISTELGFDNSLTIDIDLCYFDQRRGEYTGSWSIEAFYKESEFELIKAIKECLENLSDLLIE